MTVPGFIAGGMTAWYKDRWDDVEISSSLVDKLLNLWSASYNKDPNSACYIQRITGTDLQEGIVGEKLDTRLQVLVRDSLLKPVFNAPVTFKVEKGGGKLGTEGSDTLATEVVAYTDKRGIASVYLTLGTSTYQDPVYRKRSSGDRYAQQVGRNVVDAALANGTRLLKPFTAYGFPDTPVELVKTHGDGGTKSILSLYGFIAVKAVDKYGNPVSNVELEFAALSSDPNTDSRGARLFSLPNPCMDMTSGRIPVYGDCGEPSVSLATTSKGGAVEVILGGTPGATYPIKVTARDFDNMSAMVHLYSNRLNTSVPSVYLAAIF